MTLQHLQDVLRVEARKLTTWAKVALLSALPWTKEIVDALKEHLPELQPYLPENIYKAMGGAVMVAALVLGIWRSHQLVKAAQ